MYGDDVMPKSLFYEWYKQFAVGREECANTTHSGRPVSKCNTTSVKKVELLLRDDPRQSLRDIADNAGIN